MASIYYLDFDDENEAHIARHNVTETEIRQLLDNRHFTTPNRKYPDRILLMRLSRPWWNFGRSPTD